MGYFVQITNSTCRIPNENRQEVLQTWKDLNKPANNHLKTGGTWQGGKQTSFGYAWMDEDYDKTCKTPEDVLEMLGFEYKVEKNGDISVVGYDNKTGAAELFFERVKTLLTGEISWKGEDGARYRWKYNSKLKKGAQQADVKKTLKIKEIEASAKNYANEQSERYGSNHNKVYFESVVNGIVEECAKGCANFFEEPEKTKVLTEFLFNTLGIDRTNLAVPKKRKP